MSPPIWPGCCGPWSFWSLGILIARIWRQFSAEIIFTHKDENLHTSRCVGDSQTNVALPTHLMAVPEFSALYVCILYLEASFTQPRAWLSATLVKWLFEERLCFVKLINRDYPHMTSAKGRSKCDGVAQKWHKLSNLSLTFNIFGQRGGGKMWYTHYCGRT